LKTAIGVTWLRNYTITVVIPVPISATALVGFDITVYEITTSCDSWFWRRLSFFCAWASDNFRRFFAFTAAEEAHIAKILSI
jgi:hypothetical protein